MSNLSDSAVLTASFNGSTKRGIIHPSGRVQPTGTGFAGPTVVEGHARSLRSQSL